MTVESADLAPGLTRLQIRRALRIWNADACVATVIMTLTSGAFQTGFALYLGSNTLQIGLLAAIPAFAGLLQLLASYIDSLGVARSKVVCYAAMIGRLLWLPMLLIPWVVPSHALWVPLFLILTGVSSALMNISGPLWTAWVSDLVPADYRGRYFGTRNMWAGLVGMVTSVVAGAYFDMATKRHEFSQEAAFGTLFGLACVFSILSFGIASQSPDVDRPEPPRRPPDRSALMHTLSTYAAPFKDLNYRRVIVFYSALIIATNIAGQYFTVYQLSYLKLNYTAFQLLAAVSSVAALAAMPVWGYLADKYGNRPILSISMASVLIPPVLWIFTAPDSFPGLWTVSHGHLLISYSKLDIVALNLIAGAGWAGVQLTQFNIMIGSAPPEERTTYIAAISALTGVLGGIAPLVGGAMLVALSHVHFNPHGLIRMNYHVLFAVSCLLRVVSLVLLRPIAEPGSNSTRYVLGQLRATNPIPSFANIQQLSKASTASAREHAAEKLGQLRTPVAVEELVKALDEVALPVREKAAVALGEIGDDRAVEPLLRKMADPSAGIIAEAASALGKIGSSAAFPALAAAAQLGTTHRRNAAIEAIGRVDDNRSTALLLGLLDDPDPSIRAAVVRALSGRHEHDAASRLAQELDRESAPETIAVIAESLGGMDDPVAIDPLLSVLEKPLPETARRVVVNAVGSIIGGPDSLYPYLALDPFARDETVTKFLVGVQRRYTGRVRTMAGNRIAVRSRQALEAYAGGHLDTCVRRLADLGHEVIASMGVAGADLDRHVFERLAQRAGHEHPTSVEDVLLAVFLVKRLVDSRPYASSSK